MLLVRYTHDSNLPGKRGDGKGRHGEIMSLWLNAFKNALPRDLRKRLGRLRRRSQEQLIALDRVTDFSQLRTVTPHRRGYGSHRGTCIDRYYIEKFLEERKADIFGRVLEVQSPQYSERFGNGRITQLDVIDLAAENPRSTITADLSKCPEIADGSFDCVICTQTLLLIFKCEDAVRELHRILKPGGVALVTLPGVAKICKPEEIGGVGQDYWRFTSHSARRLFAQQFGEGNMEVVPYGNVLSAVAFLHGLVVPELTAEELDYRDPEYEVIVGVRARKAPEPANG